MSLINDALKRASKTPNDPPSGPALTVGLKPVEGKSGGGGSGGGGGKVVLVVILLVVALGGWLVRIGLQSRAKNAAKTPAAGQVAAGTNRTGTNLVAKGAATNKVAAARPSGPANAATPGRSNILTKVAATIAPYGAGEDPFKTDGAGKPASKGGPTNVAAVTSGAAAQPAADAAATGSQGWPAVRLQAIFYRLTQPSARVNGKTLLVGEDVDGIRVASIERDNVVVEYRGESKTLRFKQQP